MTINHRRLTAGLAATACCLVPAVAAQAATKEVTLGLNKSPSGLPKDAALHAWFPGKVKINVGDTVAFTSYAFGYPVVGTGKLPPMFAPDPSAPVSGANGPDDQPFWFNGQPSIRVNPFHFTPKGNGKATGRGLDSPGLSTEDGPPKAYKVRFTKPGTFKVRDGVHPDVAMEVVVVPKGEKVPSKASDHAAVARKAGRLVRRAKLLAQGTTPPGVIQAGNDSRSVGFYKFFGDPLTVNAGEPITLRTGRRSLDLHNLVIGPEAWLKTVDHFQFIPPADGKGPPNVFLGPVLAYPSQPPTAPLSFDGTQNGGYLGTGTVSADESTPFARKVTFNITKPGTYRYFCLFHAPDMSGTIKVK